MMSEIKKLSIQLKLNSTHTINSGIFIKYLKILNISNVHIQYIFTNLKMFFSRKQYTSLVRKELCNSCAVVILNENFYLIFTEQKEVLSYNF